MTSLNWDDLRVLAALDKHATPKAAARALGLSLSTLYRRLAAVEDAVGLPRPSPGGSSSMFATRTSPCERRFMSL